MLYPEKIEEKIGFTSVRAEIRQRCHCEGSRQLCDTMAFMTEFDRIDEALRSVEEMVASLKSEEAIPLEGIDDINSPLSLIKIPGTYLDTREYVKIRKMLSCFSRIDEYFRKDGDGAVKLYPHLNAISAGLDEIPYSAARFIDRAIDPSTGAVKDNASKELAEIRSQLRSISGRVNSIMRRVIADAISKGWVESDTSPSMRDGRLVIPVSPMNKRRIQGIVHDESASGKTLYIEPIEIVEANNRTRELQLEENREIVRILTSIADELRPMIPEIETGAEIVYHLDFIRAKALYAELVDGSMPVVADTQEIEWYHACHPVLMLSLRRHGREIVPLDIRQNSDRRILVISGPNAGGKSVCLKTVGTLQYMLQCGILPPAYQNSHFGIFRDIFVDIGDDQSFEDDLSTYSSHLRSMKFMLQRGNSQSLFLIDEMGSGTEPTIGGALAKAILEQMNRKKMWGVVTTHYQILKEYADNEDGLVNGSMLYDRHLMQPMFTLSIGSPGSSFALEIARKTGLQPEVIAAAEEIVGKEYVNLDSYLLDITRDRRYWENKRIAIKQKEKKLEQIIEKYAEDAEQLRTRRRQIIEEATKEAQQILNSSNAAIERTIAEIKQANAEREKTLEARRKLKEERQALEKIEESDRAANNPLLSKAPKKKSKSRGGEEVKNPEGRTNNINLGDNVRLDGGSSIGSVLEVSGNNAIVAFGNIKTTVKINRLQRTDAKPKAPRQATVSMQTIDSGYEKQLNFKQEIDVRGMRAEEALQAVTYFIDDAIRFSIPRVRILHGTGTGALRQAIRGLLSTTAGIENYHDEDVRFGGAGITVVNLK